MVLSPKQKKELKAALIEALNGKLPLKVGEFRLETTSTNMAGDAFLNVKVFGRYPGTTEDSLLTYLTVKVTEALT